MGMASRECTVISETKGCSLHSSLDLCPSFGILIPKDQSLSMASTPRSCHIKCMRWNCCVMHFHATEHLFH